MRMSVETLVCDEVLDQVLEDERAAALQEFLERHNGDIDAELADMSLLGCQGADWDEVVFAAGC